MFHFIWAFIQNIVFSKNNNFHDNHSSSTIIQSIQNVSNTPRIKNKPSYKSQYNIRTKMKNSSTNDVPNYIISRTIHPNLHRYYTKYSNPSKFKQMSIYFK